MIKSDQNSIIIEQFIEWLGSNLIDSEYGHEYSTLFSQYTNSISFKYESPLLMLKKWHLFISEIESWAHKNKVYRSIPNSPKVLLTTPERRDAKTGLRKTQLVDLCSINIASEADLRQIPGIGAAMSKKIVNWRDTNGDFQDVQELLNLGIVHKEDFLLCSCYLTTHKKHSQENERKTPSEFKEHVYLIHAQSMMNHVNPHSSLKEICINELISAVNLISQSQSILKNNSMDTDILSSSICDDFIKTLFMEEGHDKVAPLTGDKYLHLLSRLISRAENRIWIQVSSLEVQDVLKLNTILQKIGIKASTGIDVRVLIDTRYNLHTRGKHKASNYLEAQGVEIKGYYFANRMHNTVVLIDEEYLITGSHNWSANSIFLSEEVSLLLESKHEVCKASERFTKLWNAAISDKKISLDFFEHIPKNVRRLLSENNINYIHKLVGQKQVEGIDEEYLEVLKKEINLVLKYQLPPAIARKLVEAQLDLPKSLEQVAQIKSHTVQNEYDLVPLKYFSQNFVQYNKL